MTDFKLSASLSGHDDDVRGVSFASSKAVLSASRDGTVRLWKAIGDKPPTYDATISSHAASFVNAVAYLPPSQEFKDGLIIAGGQDSVIEIRQPSKGPEENAEALLLGHGHNVCALDVDQMGRFIVSGSWDAEARVWPIGKWESSTVLSGHDGSVWAVLAFDSDIILTACSDKLIRVFNASGKLQRTIQGSLDVVRALCRVPKGHPSGADFASAGNDGIIRLWTIGGTPLGELHGHESFIYSLASLPTGELVSAGEDRTVRIWKGKECTQTITHPAISVWSIDVCQETGDIVSGSSDKVVRIFTRSLERTADAETIRRFDDSVKESAIPSQQLGDVNKENLPGPDFLVQKSGTKEGQVQMIRENDGSVTAHMWSIGQQGWTNVGTVVDAVGSSGRKVEHGGKEWDFVFDVDIEDGKPPLKLPYNLSQNPYDAATKFIEDNKLPISYLDQVANFITTNTQGASIGPTQTSTAQAGSDPWGSESRYRPGGETAAAPAQAPSVPKVLPQKEYLSITVASVPKMQKKIEELNTTLISSGQKDLSLNPTELHILSALCRNLSASKLDQPIVAGGLDLAIKLGTSWPYTDRLPGLDLLRLLVAFPEAAVYKTASGEGSIVDVLIAGATEASPPAENHVMMAIRAFANIFTTLEGRTVALREFPKITNLITSSLNQGTKNRNLLVAATTLLINFAVQLTLENTDSSFDFAVPMLETLGRILESQTDAEVVYRALVAVGTLCMLSEEIRSAAKDIYNIDQVIAKAVQKVADPRSKGVVGEIKARLG